LRKDTKYGNLQIFTALIVLLCGFINYSNLFCAEHHMQCFHQHAAGCEKSCPGLPHKGHNNAPHNHNDNADMPYSLIHVFSHNDLIFPAKACDPADFSGLNGFVHVPVEIPDYEYFYHSVSSFYDMPLKFLTKQDPLSTFSQLLI